MSETTFERGKTITYPNIYPRLSFTPIFGHNGDFVWVEEVKATWAEQDDEFTFVRSTVHDQRVDRLKEENAKLRELVMQMRYGATWTHEAREYIETQMRELGIEVPK